MILYFAERLTSTGGRFQIKYSTSTDVVEKRSIVEDTTSDDLSTGIQTIDIKFVEDEELREYAIVGNFVLQHKEGFTDTLYTIIDVEHSAKDGTISIYGEDAGLSLLNRVVGAWTASEAQTIKSAVQQVLGSSYLGWTVNYGVSTTKTVGASNFDYQGDDSATSRLLSIVDKFGGELYFSYNIDGFGFIDHVINIVKKRGTTNSHTLYFGVDLDNITETASIADLATAFKLYGVDSSGNKKALSKLTSYSTYSGMTIQPSDTSTFSGTRSHTYKVVSNEVRCTDAMTTWKSVLETDGKILQVKETEYKKAKDAISYAMKELEKIVDADYNYELDFIRRPEGIQTGDTIRVVDENDHLYLQARVLSWEDSEVGGTFKATVGNFAKLQGSKADVAGLNMLKIVTLSVSSSEGLIGKDSMSTILSATVWENGTAVTNASDLADLDENYMLQWYEDGEMIDNNSDRVLDGGFRLTANGITKGVTYKCRLFRYVADDEEDEEVGNE